VGVENVDAAGVNLPGKPPGDAVIAARATVKADNLNPLLPQLVTERADGVQAEDGGLDLPCQAADGLGDEDLRTGNLHYVQDETHSWSLVPVERLLVGISPKSWVH
jgi:hypothetical protein